MGPDVFNKETGISRVYRIDCFMDVGPTVSLSHHAKGDGCCRIMLLIFYPNRQERASWGNGVFHVAWAGFTTALGNEADVIWG
jgi:hypothetical protein